MNFIKNLFKKNFKTTVIENVYKREAINIGKARLYAKYEKYFNHQCTAYERDDGIIVVYIERFNSIMGHDFVIDTKILSYQTEKYSKSI